jgi:CRP-like cAMP-binding protein
MSAALALDDPRQNRLLAALPPEEYERVCPYLEPRHLKVKQVYRYAHEPVTHVYFPINGMTSELITMADGSAVEVAVVGYEGMMGVEALFDGEPMTETLIQLSGDGMQLRAQEFQKLVVPGTAFHQLMGRYLQATAAVSAQTVACNRLHPMEERCARWLLTAQDRARADTFSMTHEFMSYMLGTRRASVTVALGILQQAGIIRYGRGQVTVLDRAGLESTSCECYGVMRAAFERVTDR